MIGWPQNNRSMKKIACGKKCLLVAASVFALTVPGKTQGAQPNEGWNARMAALQEEHDAQAGVAVSIVFDDSGSMDDNDKLVMAKKAFRTWIEHAPDTYRFGLEALNAGVLVPLQRHDRAQVLAAVDHLRASGDTPLADTIAQTAKAIQKRRAAGAEYERQVVVVLTDGEDNTRRGPKGVQQEIRALRASGVEVIAFGYQGEGDYMRGSATHFYSPENGQDIGKGLDAIGSEIGDTSDVVLDDATRAQMQKVAAATPVAPASLVTPTPTESDHRVQPFSPDTATPEPTRPSRQSVQQLNRRSGSHTGIWVAIAVVLFLAFSRGRRR